MPTALWLYLKTLTCLADSLAATCPWPRPLDSLAATGRAVQVLHPGSLHVMQLAGLKGGLNLVHKCCCRSSRRVGRTFAAMTPAQASVGIIGGGLAGTSCAGALADHGIRCHIFDMGFSGPGGHISPSADSNQRLHYPPATLQAQLGRLSAGGRSSTRVREQYQYDHGCQYVAVPGGLQATFSQLERYMLC